MTDAEAIASLSDTLSYISIAIMAILLGYATRWFGSGPYRWAVITVGVVLLFRIILIVFVDALVPGDVLGFILDDVIVGHLKVLVASIVTTFIAVWVRHSAAKPATSVASPYAVPTYPPAPPTVPMAAPTAAPPTVAMPTPPSAPPRPPAGWYPDPELRGIVRYWHGTEWTEHRRNA